MPDLLVVSLNDIEIYQSEIDVLCEDYISALPDPAMIYKSMTFKGLLNYIYRFYLRDIIETDKHNRHSNNSNYDLLDAIFNNVYLPLCAKYSIVPTVLSFCVFVNISHGVISDFKNGVHHVDKAKANEKTRATVLKWYTLAESSLADKAFNENGIGAIFGLKAAHGWSDQPQEMRLTIEQQSATPEQIAARYSEAAKPELKAFVQSDSSEQSEETEEH